MEKLLLKLASQLDSIDQASLDALWDKYAQIVNNFEPTKRWEEAVLVLSFIQAKNWKNQLFNTQWAMRSKVSSLIDIDGTGTKNTFSGMVKELKKKISLRKELKFYSSPPKHKISLPSFRLPSPLLCYNQICRFQAKALVSRTKFSSASTKRKRLLLQNTSRFHLW